MDEIAWVGTSSLPVLFQGYALCLVLTHCVSQWKTRQYCTGTALNRPVRQQAFPSSHLYAPPPQLQKKRTRAFSSCYVPRKNRHHINPNWPANAPISSGEGHSPAIWPSVVVRNHASWGQPRGENSRCTTTRQCRYSARQLKWSSRRSELFSAYRAYFF